MNLCKTFGCNIQLFNLLNYCMFSCPCYRCSSRQRTPGWWRGRDGWWVRPGGRQGTGAWASASRRDWSLQATAGLSLARGSPWRPLIGWRGQRLVPAEVCHWPPSHCITPGSNPLTMTRWRQISFWLVQETKDAFSLGWNGISIES